MKVLYQADNDLRKAIVRGAVRREPAARLDGVSDRDVLAAAAAAFWSHMISKRRLSIFGCSSSSGEVRACF